VGQQNYHLGGFDWLDKKSSLRRWFADWLTENWRNIYGESLHQLHTKADFERYGRMENAVKSLAAKLPRLSTAEQLAAVDAKARKSNFVTTRERLEDELRYFLTRAGKHRKHAAAFKASPWCAHFSTNEHILERAGKNLPYKVYPHDPDARLALENVISEFGSVEIPWEVSPAVAQLFATQRDVAQFENAINSLPAESPLLRVLPKIKPGLHELSTSLQAEINQRPSEPAVRLRPLRSRRLDRRVYFAVRRLCKPSNGPEKLARFIQNLLMRWPIVPAGMEFDLESHFHTNFRRELVCDHYGAAAGRLSREACAAWYILEGILARDELRGSLLHLAHKARQHAQQRRKGWERLRKALRTVFNQIRRKTSDEEMFRNFERANFAAMRNLTREQRMHLLPECGNDPDHSVRDLTRAERMILFKRSNKRSRTVLGEHDPDGKSSFATRYGRAMKDVKKELGQD
jgi:hypothetical protein